MAAPAAAAAAGGSAAATAAPYIAAGVSAGSGIVGAITNRRSQKRAYEYNRKLMLEQYALEREQQDYQNLYNSPIEQRKRLEAAGFNPNGDNLQSYASVDAAAPDYTPMQPLDYSGTMQQIGNSFSAYVQTKQQLEQIKAMEIANKRNQLLYNKESNDVRLQYSEMMLKRSNIYHSLRKQGVSHKRAWEIANSYSTPFEGVIGTVNTDPDLEESYYDSGNYGNIEYQKFLDEFNLFHNTRKVRENMITQDYLKGTYDATKAGKRNELMTELHNELQKKIDDPMLRLTIENIATEALDDGLLETFNPSDFVSGFIPGGKFSKFTKRINPKGMIKTNIKK